MHVLPDDCDGVGDADGDGDGEPDVADGDEDDVCPDGWGVGTDEADPDADERDDSRWRRGRPGPAVPRPRCPGRAREWR